jgi:outer membrane lipoprotein LolB
MRMRSLLLALSLLLLAGCAAFESREALQGEGDARLWQAHKDTIATIDGWQISGKLGIRAPDDSATATLFWLQRQGYFDIRLSGPLGGGAARLSGREDAVTLELANRKTYKADSPEDLLEAGLGWRLPVSHLLWWVRGLPAPDSRSQIELDAQSRLASLQQDGWQVSFPSYVEENGYMLPQRIKLQGANLQITLVIKSWQPRRLGQ